MRLATITMTGAVALLAATAARAQVAACLAPPGQAAPAAGVTVRDLPERDGDLRILRVEASHGAYMLVYYDAASERIARSRAACLGAQLDMLRADLSDDREGAAWHSVVFTTDRNYLPPRGDGHAVRWIVHTDPNGWESVNIDRMVLGVMPHEQTHGYQGRTGGAGLPRWFSEGHATWVGLRVTALLDPARGAADRAEKTRDRATATGPLGLAAWGSVRPRREAIMRQVSAEDRARMEREPTYMPQGMFRFTTADLEGDESNMKARYAGALAVLEGLEARHGVAKVRAWVREVTSAAGPVTPATLADSVRRHFDEDLDRLLAAQN